MNPHQCDECKRLLHELRAVMYEAKVFPKVTDKLREDYKMVLRLGTLDGVDEAIKLHAFLPEKALEAPKHPRIAAAVRKLSEHCYQCGHNPLFS